MRYRLVVPLAAIVALIGGSTAGGAAAEQSSPNAADARMRTGVRAVSYLFKAEFGLGYDVDWTEVEGDPLDLCSSWRDDRGTLEVNARSTAPMTGRLTIFGRRSRDNRFGGWADLATAGPAKGVVHRTLRQRGGPTPGCPGEPFRVPPNDCGGGRGREYTTRLASIRAELRRDIRPLDLATTPLFPASAGQGLVYVLSVTAVGRVGYARCRTSRYARELPGNFGLPLYSGDDVPALRNLRPGETYRVERQWAGDCIRDLPREAACRFELDMHVDIRRCPPSRDPRRGVDPWRDC